MSYLQFANIFSVVSGFVAGVFFCVGSALLTTGTIQSLAGTYWEENPHLARFLTATRAEYLCGGLALCATFVLQFMVLLSAVPDGAAFTSYNVGAAFALIAGLALFSCLWVLRSVLIHRVTRAVLPETNVP